MLYIIITRLQNPHVTVLLLFCSILFIFTYFFNVHRTRKRRVLELLHGQHEEEIKRQVGLSWFKNLITPLLPNKATLASTQKILNRAGFKMSPEEFFATRIAAGVIGGGLFSLLFIPNLVYMLLFGIAGGYLFFLVPQTLAANKSMAIKKAASRQCLDYVDLLKIAVAEGADITHAVEMVSGNYPGVLANAFSDAITKAKGGKPVLEALQDMAQWLDTKDVNILVDSIVQSRKTGTSLVAVLEAQSMRMRDALKSKATEQAQKAPVKMVFPLMLCILPSLMVIAMGPPMMQLKDVFNF